MTSGPSSLLDATIIDGKAVAAEVILGIKAKVAASGVTPGLAVVLVGENPASAVYVRNKSARAKECGFLSRQVDMPADVSQENLLALIDALNQDPSIHGILVQLPLPRHIDAKRVVETIDPRKDVDGFHHVNAGLLAVGNLDAGFVPCTPLGAMVLIKRAVGVRLDGLHAVVIGRSNIVGKPVAALLLAENCSISIIHSKTPNPETICRQADIIIAAVGVAGLVKAAWVKPGAVVIDVGINRVVDKDGKSRLVGDVDFESVKPISRAITPVPGGVGPMTIAMLLRNTLHAALRVGVGVPQTDWSPYQLADRG
jgi:methylenetetrahydrofolate dehydrogenase (NADP+)/methenyltetrahydrofolate cyclohydrolase